MTSPQHISKTFFALLVLIFSHLIVVAGSTDPMYTRFLLEDGLSSNLVLTLHNAKDGALWIGTDAGLCSFNGKEFTRYTTLNNREPIIVDLEEYRDTILALSLKCELYYLDRNKHLVAHPKSRRIQEECAKMSANNHLYSEELNILPDGTLLVGHRFGVVRIKGQEIAQVATSLKSNRHLLVEMNSSLMGVKKGRQNASSIDIAIGGDTIKLRNENRPTLGGSIALHTAFESDSVFAFCHGSRLYASKNGKINLFDLPAVISKGIFHTNSGSLWVGMIQGKQGLLVIDNESVVDTLFKGFNIYSILEDFEGGYWIGTDEGLIYIPELSIKSTPLEAFYTQTFSRGYYSILTDGSFQYNGRKVEGIELPREFAFFTPNIYSNDSCSCFFMREKEIAGKIYCLTVHANG